MAKFLLSYSLATFPSTDLFIIIVVSLFVCFPQCLWFLMLFIFNVFRTFWIICPKDTRKEMEIVITCILKIRMLFINSASLLWQIILWIMNIWEIRKVVSKILVMITIFPRIQLSSPSLEMKLPWLLTPSEEYVFLYIDGMCPNLQFRPWSWILFFLLLLPNFICNQVYWLQVRPKMLSLLPMMISRLFYSSSLSVGLIKYLWGHQLWLFFHFYDQ